MKDMKDYLDPNVEYHGMLVCRSSQAWPHCFIQELSPVHQAQRDLVLPRVKQSRDLVVSSMFIPV